MSDITKGHFMLIDLLLVHRMYFGAKWRGRDEEGSLGLEQWASISVGLRELASTARPVRTWLLILLEKRNSMYQNGIGK